MANKFLHWDDVTVSRANELMTQFYFSEDRFNSWEFKFYYILSAFCLFLLIFGIFIALNALKWQVYNVNYIFVRCFKMALPCQTLVKNICFDLFVAYGIKDRQRSNTILVIANFLMPRALK